MQEILKHSFIDTFWWRKSKLLLKMNVQVYVFPPDNVWLITCEICQPASYDPMLYIDGVIPGLLIKDTTQLLPQGYVVLNAVYHNHITTDFDLMELVEVADDRDHRELYSSTTRMHSLRWSLGVKPSKMALMMLKACSTGALSQSSSSVSSIV